MIRILKLVFLLVISQVAFAQAPSNYTNINGRYRWIAGMFDSTFHIPKGTTPSLRTGGSTNPGALFYKTGDSSLYIYTGTQWLKQAGTAGFVPYSGATDTLDMGQFGVKTKFVQFDTSSREVTDRTLQWSNDNGTLAFGMTNGSTITQNVGLQQFARVKNVQGSQINKGQVVYLYGASGDRAAVKLADNRNDSTSSKTLGIAVENIPINGEGFVGTFGTMSGLNLSAYTAGNILYLDSIPGGLTKTKPQAPYHMVFIGVVERANSGNGLLFTNVQNGYELDELHNVKITSPVRNNALLVYDSLNRLWVDTTIAQAGLAVTSVATNTATGITGGTITSTGTLAIDTLLISTRAWRQKGIDSIKANYVPYTGATTNVNLGVRTLTATGVYSNEGMYVANTYGLYGRNAANNASPLLIGITGLDKVYIDGGSAGSIFGGNVSISVLDNATTDTDQFLVSDGGVVKYRTGAQVLSDIGGASSSSISGTTNYIPKFTSSSAIGNSIMSESSSNINVAGSVTIQSGNALYVNNTTNTRSGSLYTSADGTELSSFNGAGEPLLLKSPVGYIAMFTGGSERMRLTSTGLGIGTSSPAYKLDVNGNAHIGTGDSRLIIGDVASANTESVIWLRTGSGKYAYSIAAQSLADESLTIARSTTQGGTTFTTASLTLNASGNLGLGVTPSAWTVFKVMQIGAGFAAASSGTGNARIFSNTYYDGSYRYVANGTATQFEQDGYFAWYTAPSGTAGNAITFSQAMILNASGNLGLGVTPSAWGSSNKVYETTFATSMFGRSDFSAWGRNAYYNSSDVGIYANNGHATLYIQTSGQHQWLNATSGTAGNAISFTQAMTLDASGRLGVGVTSPSTTFDVNGTINVRTNGFEFGRISTNNVSSNTGGLTFQYNASGTFTTGMVLNGSGNVSVGTTSSFSRFNVSNGASTRSGITITDGNTASLMMFAGASADAVIAVDANNLAFKTGATVGQDNGTTRMTITSAGSVGIGVSSPSTKLEVAGIVRGEAVNVYGSTDPASTSPYLYSPSTGALGIGANGSERMRVTSGGDILVGITSTFTNARYQSQNVTATKAAMALKAQATSSSGLVEFHNPNGQVGEISVSGTSTTYSTSSDYRLKQDLKNFNGLNLVDSIKVYDYQWKADNTRSYGVLAHELQSVLPYAVTGEKDGEKMQGVDYSKIVPILIKSIQELKAEIETLKNK